MYSNIINKYDDVDLKKRQEIIQIISGNANEIENFKNFIESYEKSINETLFKNLNDVKYLSRNSKKIVLEHKDIIINFLNYIEKMGMHRLKNADVINIKNLLMKIKSEKIFKLEENITKYKNRNFFNYEKTDTYIIDKMKELCEDFKSVIDYYENPLNFQKEEIKRKAREQYEKKFSEKNKEKNHIYNSITNSAEKGRLIKDVLWKNLKKETTNGFMLRPKYLKKGLKVADLYNNYLEEIKKKGDIVSLIGNKMSSNLTGLLFTFIDNFYAEREKRGKNLDATYLKNNFKTKYEKLNESIRVKLEEFKDSLKRCSIKINEPCIFPYVGENYETKIFLLDDVIEHIKKVKLEFFTRNKALIDSKISSLFSKNHVHEYAIIRKQYEKILNNLEREKNYLKRINKFLKKYFELGQYDCFKYECCEYLDDKLKQIANIYAYAILDNAEYKDDSVDYYVYDNADFDFYPDSDHVSDSDYVSDED